MQFLPPNHNLSKINATILKANPTALTALTHSAIIHTPAPNDATNVPANTTQTNSLPSPYSMTKIMYVNQSNITNSNTPTITPHIPNPNNMTEIITNTNTDNTQCTICTTNTNNFITNAITSPNILT